jgi:hypothetical protein
MDIKATLRSQARGDDRVFIRENPRSKTAEGENDAWDPVVWLLRPGQKLDREWEIIGYNCGALRQHAKDPEKFDCAAARFGIRQLDGQMVEAVSVGRRFGGGSIPEDMAVPEGLRRCENVRCSDYDGLLNYTPPFLDARQQVLLAEETNFKKRMFYSSNHERCDILPASMRWLFIEHFKMDLDPNNWSVSLVRMGIPLARQAVTVVAPDNFQLPASVYADATRNKVKVRVIPHSYFPKETLRRLGQIYWVPPATETGALIFDESYSRILEETPETFRNLIPRRWLDYPTRSHNQRHA